MKKNDLSLLISVLAYSYLFYHQSAGINFLIFSLLITILLYFKKSGEAKNFSWFMLAICSIITGFSVMWYGNSLSVTANIISLMILSGLTIQPGSSIIIAGINTAYSFATSLIRKLLALLENKVAGSPQVNHPPIISTKTYAIGIPVIITIAFFFIYRSANIAFYNFTQLINLNFISWEWLGFTLSGIFILFGLFNQKIIKALHKADEKASDNLNKDLLPDHSQTWLGKFLNIENEFLSGLLLFSMLNLLLLSVNIIDISYLWGGIKLPDGFTYSEYVHSGVGMIVFSIISAIAIILFYFRGHLNFHRQNNTLKIIACVWIIQNIFMLASTAYRNQLYIEEYSLTYKRIGVFVYLLLTLTGLVSTFIKINFTKSNWFLFRKNAWVFYFFLIVATTVNWDFHITLYNLKNSKKPDLSYLIGLDHLNIPVFLHLQPDILHIKNPNSIQTLLQLKIKYFEKEWQESGWQSWNYTKQHVYSIITPYHPEPKKLNKRSSHLSYKKSTDENN